MNSSEEKRPSEENGPTPFFNLDGEAWQPSSKCWGQNHTCSPLSVPGAGFRNENLYFPGSLAPRKHLDFHVPQSPLPTAPNQRPDFWHCSGHRGKMRREGTQTKRQQPWHNRVSPSSRESRGVLCNLHVLAPSLEKVCGEERGEMDRYLLGHLPSAAPLAQYKEFNEAVQCDMDWLECAERGGRAPSASLGGRKGAGGEAVLGGGLGREEVGEQGSWPSAARLARSNKIHEAVHWDTGRGEDAELEDSPEQMPLVSEEAPNCTAAAPAPRKTPRSRELKEPRTAFLTGKNHVATLTKEITLNISDECALEDKACEIEWVFEEEVSGLSSKRFDREESWGSYFCSLLLWLCRSKINKKNDEYEGISRSLLSYEKEDYEKI